MDPTDGAAAAAAALAACSLSTGSDESGSCTPLLDLPRGVVALIAGKVTRRTARVLASTNTSALHAVLEARNDLDSFFLDPALARCFSVMMWQYGGWQSLVDACTKALPQRANVAPPLNCSPIVLRAHLPGQSGAACKARVSLHTAVLICTDAHAPPPCALIPRHCRPAGRENVVQMGGTWRLSSDAWRLVQNVECTGDKTAAVILPRRMHGLTTLDLNNIKRLG